MSNNLSRNQIIVSAERLENVQFSPVRQVMDRMRELEKEGHSIIPFQIGEPDFDTPQSIIDATIKALQNKMTHYAPNRGCLSLRKAISALLESKGLTYDAESEVLVTVGGAEAILDTILALVDEGDEVIVPTPSFMNYKNVVAMAKGVFVEYPLHADDQFQIIKESLESKITSRTKMIIINNPSNPTGIVFTEAVLKDVADIAIKHDLIVFSDEIYDEITYEGTICKSIASFPGMKERTIVMNGFSKAFAMTGWRLGYLAAPSCAITTLLKVHQYATTCAPTFIQEGVAQAMLTDACIDEKHAMVEAFSKKRKLLTEGLKNISGLEFSAPHGAFYVFVDVSQTGLTGEEFAQRLLVEHHVAVVPGIGFSSGSKDFIRMSFATSEENITQGLERIARFVADLG